MVVGINLQDARRKEREAAASHKEARTALSNLSVMGPRPINIEDKYMFMIAASNVKGEGAADSAWDDWCSLPLVPLSKMIDDPMPKAPRSLHW